MANALYNAAKDAFGKAGINWNPSGGDTFKIQLIDTGAYTVSLTTHANLSDVAAGSRIGSPATLTVVAPSAGVFDAADPTLLGITGTSIEAFIIYKSTGTESTSTLILYCDTATNLPFTPAGTDVTIQFPNDANKLFHF